MTITYRLPQQRRLVTELPGPRSQALDARRKKAVPAGTQSSTPVYAAEADGGVIVDVDGNSLIDLASGVAVTGVGASNPDVVAAMAEPRDALRGLLPGGRTSERADSW